MPIYAFTNGTDTIEKIVPMGTKSFQEQGCRWRRVPIARFAATGFARQATAADEVKRGFHQMENRHGSRWPISFSKTQVRKIWGI
jgi:hypothetical protein